MPTQDQTFGQRSLFDKATQVFLPTFTIAGFFLTAAKAPQYGLLLNLVAQVFWFYAAWKSWREAGQIGILITSVLITVILIAGVVNYWLL